jgi:hypothetical protein
VNGESSAEGRKGKNGGRAGGRRSGRGGTSVTKVTVDGNRGRVVINLGSSTCGVGHGLAKSLSKRK